MHASVMAAKDKLKRLFGRAYDRRQWLRMLGEHLPIDQFSRPLSLNTVKGSAQAFYQLGSVSLADDKTLGIYEITTNPETRLHRNRVQMRQLVAKHCQQSALDGALTVYACPQRPSGNDAGGHWRFSFLSMEYKLTDQGRINKRESAPKRCTYLLGTGANVRTAVERFSRLHKTATLDDVKTAFAVEQLNKEFYETLFTWYERAKSHVVFPNDEREEEDAHVSTSLIRLLTRLLFVWFLKEKGLINQDFFDPEKVRHMIDWNKESGYYKAILQNLFFATLNREMTDRTFRTTTNGKPNGNNYLVTNIYRYQHIFVQRDTRAILRLFARAPFLNGGLFECLDREANEEEQRAYEQDGALRKERRAIRVDGFSDRDDNVLHVPNDLFFNEDEHRLGLMTLLNRYQFTVEESTPLDADVALDPELLGLVFENLLASYNPETQQTARKASGSYYTPREIVDYMVDESLKAYFAQATDVAGTKISRVFMLLQASQDPTTGAERELTEDETAALIREIDTIKIIDPAVGSGAFPMGILQRLVQILGIVDPENTRWKQRQLDIIDELPDVESREQARKDVETIFSATNRFNDFGRKLYLIEKCIYGVDVQPIACQIAKLRFFISLTIEQEPTDDAYDNYGVKPLPNLETKFVAADTLLGLDKPAQRTLGHTDAVNRLERELNANRERYFRATTRQTKEKYRKTDKDLRNRLATELKQAGFPVTDADKIARWDPYDQNARADWFDPEYMFGAANGFNVVIGNPPYIQLQKEGGKLGNLYKDAGFDTFARTGDIYQLFYEKGCRLLAPQRGILVFITSNKWMRAGYGEKLREYLASQTDPKILLDFGSFQVFENATVDTNILLTQKAPPCQKLQATHFADDFQRDDSISDYAKSNSVSITTLTSDPWLISGVVENAIKRKIDRVGTPLKEWDVSIYRGVTTGLNDAFVIDDATRQALITEDPNSAEILKPVLRGRDIKRYQARWADLWLVDTHNGCGDVPAININDYPAIKTHLDGFYPQLEKRYDKGRTTYNLRNCAYHQEFAKEKLVWAELSRSGNAFSYDDRGSFQLNTTYMMTGVSLHYLLAVLNSRVMLFYLDLTNQKLDKNGWRWLGQYVERLPIPQIPAAEQRPFIRLVDRILSAKTADPKADTTEQEAEIDRLVYHLYGLTPEQRDLIENLR